MALWSAHGHEKVSVVLRRRPVHPLKGVCLQEMRRINELMGLVDSEKDSIREVREKYGSFLTRCSPRTPIS